MLFALKHIFFIIFLFFIYLFIIIFFNITAEHPLAVPPLK